MREALPWLPRFFSGSTDLAAFDAGEEQAREARLTGMAFPMHRAEIEELIAKGVALFILREDVLERESQFAKARCFGPGTIRLVVFDQCDIGEEATAAMGAFFETGLKLVREDAA
jgi:hypothetical protein